jgi:hypothetical protein
MENQLSNELISSKGNDQSKNSEFATIITIFKCAVGLGIMTNPIFFAQGGWMLSIIIIAIISYLVAYNMTLLADVVDHIEKNNDNADLDQMEDCLQYVIKNKNWRKFLFLGKSNEYAKSLSSYSITLLL